MHKIRGRVLFAGDVEGPLSANVRTDDYTIGRDDVGNVVEMNKGTAVTLTVPPSANQAASGTLTIVTTGAVADETVTIDGVVYTWKAVPSAPYEVDIGASNDISADNLVAAINRAAGEGTLYGTNTTVHPTVSAAAGGSGTVVVTAKTAGVAGNAIATTETMTQGSWGAATLAGGADGVTIPVGARVKVVQTGAGACTLAAGFGVTLHVLAAKSGLAMAQWGAAELYHQATDVWVASGDLT